LTPGRAPCSHRGRTRFAVFARRSIPISPRFDPPSLLVAHGPRAAEAVLFDELDALLSATGDLGRPVRVVVPSRSLRRHLSAAYARRRGRAALSLTIQTLFGLALEVLGRTGRSLAEGDAIFGLLVRRFAAATPSLAGPLNELVEGYGPVVGTVRDLLDAGLEEAHAGAAVEALAELGPWVSRAERERAEELLGLALVAERGLTALGLQRRTEVLRRAASALGAAPDPQALLPSRALLVHGFADLTGLAADLLETLVRHLGGRVILDRPPDPADPAAVEIAFSTRLAERFGSSSTTVPPRDFPATRQAFAAPGADAETREVARRIRHLLDAGARPEGIGVVARDLGPGGPYGLALRRHLTRFAVPFSGAGSRGPWLPRGRRLQALVAILRRGPLAPTGRWLEALAPPPGADPGRHALAAAELRLAFHSLGAGRLGEVAELDPAMFDGRDFLLPIVQGFRSRASDDEKDLDEAAEISPEKPERRKIKYSRLARAISRAQGLHQRLSAWPLEAPLEDHLARLESLVTTDLGWQTEPARGELDALLERLRRSVPAAFEIRSRELVDLVSDELAEAGRDELGGAGGGVALLGATEARGATFEHLFLVGLNRDVFPRPIAEDPLLPDDLRRALARVLPDLVGKAAGHGEERHLFASLLAAAPRVTLSWQATSDDGQPRPPSPLVERLLAAEGGLEVATLAPWMSAEPWGDLPPEDRAIVAGLAGDGAALAATLAADAEMAAARLAILAELDGGPADDAPPGAYLGRVGPSRPGDRRAEDPPVTTFESLAACPWRTFLERVLRVVPTPDPLLAAPALTPLLVGAVVHGVLAEIVNLAAPPVANFDEARERTPVAPPWPADADFEELLRREARRVLTEQAAALPGLARALAEAARPYLEAARRAEATGTAVLAAEVKGELAVVDGAGRERRLTFRADLVERMPERIATPFRPELEPLRMTDFKTGKPFSSAARAQFREGALQKDVASGKRLQAVAYALAAGPGGVGRYLYLKPEIPDEQREIAARGDALHFALPFAAAVATAFDAWDAGAFVPRLTDPESDKEPRRCSYCPVHEACARGDSGARRRLVRWAGAALQGGLDEGDDARALAGIWFLPARKP
jgi:hypothetical protein